MFSANVYHVDNSKYKIFRRQGLYKKYGENFLAVTNEINMADFIQYY